VRAGAILWEATGEATVTSGTDRRYPDYSSAECDELVGESIAVKKEMPILIREAMTKHMPQLMSHEMTRAMSRR
jgi:hypothetical protein